MKDDTLFINVIVWGKQGETVSQHLAKGRSVLVEGRLQERRWEADGQQKSKFEVVSNVVRFLGKKDDHGSHAPSGDEGEFAPPEGSTDLEPF
jgi:single-strand DNA-binding protein